MLKLIGIGIVALGFACEVNPLLVVVLAGFATGLVGGMSLHTILMELGTGFVKNRSILLPVVMILPTMGLLEKYGLKIQAQALIRKMKHATAGHVILAYTAIRQISISVGLNFGGHASMIRPVIAPMAEGAALSQNPTISEKLLDSVKAHASAAENTGAFFGEDIFIAGGGVVLMHNFFEAEGMKVGLWSIALWGIPTALAAFCVMTWRCYLLDKRIALEGYEVDKNATKKC
jgi:uncharacterized membrane protein